MRQLHATFGKLQLDHRVQFYVQRWKLPEKQHCLRNVHDALVCPWVVCEQLHEPRQSAVPQLHSPTWKLLVGEWLRVCVHIWLVPGHTQQLLQVHFNQPVPCWILQNPVHR